jgi:hypothetical protein
MTEKHLLLTNDHNLIWVRFYFDERRSNLLGNEFSSYIYIRSLLINP